MYILDNRKVKCEEIKKTTFKKPLTTTQAPAPPDSLFYRKKRRRETDREGDCYATIASSDE